MHRCRNVGQFRLLIMSNRLNKYNNLSDIFDNRLYKMYN